MKIVSWNCNLNLAKKFVHLEAIDADIFIIQECEKLKEDYFPNAKFFWTGRIENKGLGIIIKNKSALLDPIHNPNFINFLPIRSDEIKIMGIWAFNHRAAKFGDNVSGKTIEAINHYKNWLVEDQMPSVFAGDFNNSVIWDKSKNENNFENINKKLESFGFLSTYHSLTGDVFGDEDKPTFFHTKNILKQYHIDYIYLKSSEVTSVKVGEYHDWIKLSDHVPIITEITN